VKGCKSIYDSFKAYTAKEMLDGDNKYDAGNLGKQDAEKGVGFNRFPPVLTIHLKRFDFDVQRMGFAKIHDRFVFPARLELDQFLYKETGADKDDKDECGEGNAVNGKSSAAETTECAPSSSSSSRTSDISNNFILHSVLIHSGDVGGGHYYAYIRPSGENYDYGAQTWNLAEFKDNPEWVDKLARRGPWYKFDDEKVTRVAHKDAIDRAFGTNHNMQMLSGSAYMLVYIRESEAHNIMQHLGPDDIPASLKQRLDREEREGQFQKVKSEIDDMCGTLHMFNVDALSTVSLTDHTENNMLYDSSEAREERSLGPFTYLSALFHAADVFDENVIDTRLYNRLSVSSDTTLPNVRWRGFPTPNPAGKFAWLKPAPETARRRLTPTPTPTSTLIHIPTLTLT